MKIVTVLVNLMQTLALLYGACREEAETPHVPFPVVCGEHVWMFVRERYALYVTELYCVML